MSASWAQKFDRNYLGVAFSPYTDIAPGRYWDAYSVQDIMNKLSVVRQYFSIISTYGMGVADYNRGKNWDQCDSNALVAKAASMLNQQGSGPKLTVNIGVFQLGDADQQREIDNAFTATADANGRAPGTVTGITFTNEYIHSVAEGQRVLAMLQNNRDRAHGAGLRVGVRTEICGVYTNPSDPLRGIMNQIAQASDFIYCNIYPSQQDSNNGAEAAADAVANYFFYVRSEIQKVNPNLEVMIGETGWPSEGNSFNNSPNTVANEVAYWKRINWWASNTQIKIQMFQAIDEPWKGDSSQFKGEGHYGWWYKPNNNDDRHVEKDS